MGLRDYLDWEENVFRGLVAAWRRLRGRAPDPGGDAPGVAFDDVAERLTVFAQLLTGEPVRLRVATGEGGLRGSDLLLPARVSLGQGDELDRDAYRVQVVVLAAMHALGDRGAGASAETFDGAIEALRLTREAVEAMTAELPGFAALHERVIERVVELRRDRVAGLSGLEGLLEGARVDALRGGRPWEDDGLCVQLRGRRSARRRSPALPIWGEWLELPADVATGAGAGDEPREQESPTTEMDAPAVSGIRRVELAEESEDDAPPVVPFESAESIDSHRGGRRDLDGSDELEAHLEALEEVELGDLFRTNQTAGSLLKMDLDLAGDLADAEPDPRLGRGIPYDEWDARRRGYRKGWCTVYPRESVVGDGRWAAESLSAHRALVRRLRRQLESYRAGLRPAARQLDGEEIDLDAAQDERAATAAGHGGDPRLYVRQQKRRRDFATLVLIDASMSTDSWVDGRRILDVAREAALVLGEVAHELGDRLEILAFASETRNHCFVWTLYREGEAWSLGKRRLGALEPRGYTRIGPALRHATATLSATPAERRLLLLISDGKPTDYDRYEGRYGVADVRQALREAHQSEIHTHALAVDEVARETMPLLFGRGGFDILARPEQLVESLTTVYGRLTAR